MPLFTVKGAIDHVTGIAESGRKLAIEIGVVLNNKQAHAGLRI